MRTRTEIKDMTNGVSRRAFLTSTTAAAAVVVTGAFPGTSSAVEARVYNPSYFTQAEWSFLVAAIDRLIPEDDQGPGGVESGVPEFIDRQMEAPYGHGAFAYMSGPFLPDLSPSLGYQLRYTPREMYRVGIAAVDDACRKQHASAFSQLTPELQDLVLQSLESGATALDGPPATAFFAQLLRNAREGFFADPMYGGNKRMGAWKMIGFPGARADFTDWMDQPGRRYPYGPVSVNGNQDS